MIGTAFVCAGSEESFEEELFKTMNFLREEPNVKITDIKYSHVCCYSPAEGFIEKFSALILFEDGV